MVVVQREANLLEIIDALSPPRRLAGRLHRRQQQRDQDSDDGDDDQKLNQGETTSAHVDPRSGWAGGPRPSPVGRIGGSIVARECGRDAAPHAIRREGEQAPIGRFREKAR